LRTKVTSFQRSLFDADGKALVRGLDKTIVIDPRRLHLTLGVMALDNDTRTVSDALKLLESTQPELRSLLEEHRTVKVKLETLDVLKIEKRNDEDISAHVLYLGVNEADHDSERLKRVCNKVHQTFRTAGYITETRPLKLHCTILNTSHRRPRSREAFSWSDIQKMAAVQSFGMYDAGRIELWKMGSHNANNEYESCGGVDLG